MAAFYPLLYRAFLSRIDPERAHRLGLASLRIAQRWGGLPLLRRLAAPRDARLERRLFGLTFSNPVGVAAGMDKDAEAAAALFALGFGHVEVGTVTPRPQPGNDRPRVWRFPAERALVNALGFPSAGAESVRTALEAIDRSKLVANGTLGVNLGKNRDTPLEQAAADYAGLIDTLYELADYFTINISSPNTPGLRQLQSGEYLSALLHSAVEAVNEAAKARGAATKPLLLKLSPDLPDEQLPAVAETAASSGISGLIATNTTTSREGVDAAAQRLPGGLSGAPLQQRSRRVIKLLFRAVGQRLPIVGVGGVGSAEDAVGHLRAGASLVQLYSGFVYGGPGTAGRIVAAIGKIADREGWTSIEQIVGLDAGGD